MKFKSFSLIVITTCALLALCVLILHPVSNVNPDAVVSPVLNIQTETSPVPPVVVSRIKPTTLTAQEETPVIFSSIPASTPPSMTKKTEKPPLISPNKARLRSQQQPMKKASGPQLHVVTYASHGGRDDRFCRAIESTYHHNIDLIILGWGVKWTGLSQKLYAAYHYTKALPEDDIVLFVDAFDVMFANTEEYILTRYLDEHSNDLLFGAECGCW